MNWLAELSASAVKELKKLPQDRQRQIERAIDEMEADLMAGDVKPLKGSTWKNRYRKRAGDYRIIFALDRKNMTVAISAILLRSEKTYR
jgi:mRNA-degrading endonuclease RelE of RelBE toxin-antitoxin system